VSLVLRVPFCPHKSRLACIPVATLGLLLAALSLSGHALALDSDEPTAESLQFERCTIGDRRATLKARCATLEVALDPSSGPANQSAAGQTTTNDSLHLAIARIPARGRKAQADPVVFISGGPGQSARDTYPAIARAFRHVNRDRDIIIVDQRGTGASELLDCPTGPDGLAGDNSTEALAREARESATDCLASLEADPRLFTTSVAVRDLEQVRKALGVDSWNLYGVSYGTRVALHYARRYPARTRALVLDAVVPPGIPLGPDIAPLAQRALSLILQRCAANQACNNAFPDIESRTSDFIDRLESGAIDVEWEDIAQGSLETSRFSREDLAVTLRLLAYSAHGASLLPSLLDDAIEQDHLAPLARQAALQTRELQASLATGMHYAVVCTEDLPFMDADAARAKAADTFLGSAPLTALEAACDAWPAGIIDDDFHALLDSDVPTLILSGEADPVTPPAYGDRLTQTLGNATHIVNEGQGHMQLPLGCVPQLFAEFVDAADGTDLSLACLDRLYPPPFFVDANGPHP